jgi:hypothetical protein
MSYIKELAHRLYGVDTPSERRKIEAEFEAEGANPPEMIEWYARALSGEVVGRTAIRCFGSPLMRLEVTVRFDPTAPDGFAIFPARYDDPAISAGALRLCRAHFKERIATANAAEAAPSMAAIAGKSNEERLQLAGWLWKGADAPLDMARDYLERRAITIAPRYAGRVIRCRWGGWGEKGHPDTMVCAMRDVLTDELRAVHTTPFDEDWNVILDTDGKKARRTIGLMKGAAIKFSSHAEVIEAGALVVAEGVETALSALQMGFAPVWALGGTSNIYSLPVIHGIDELVLLGERDDGASERACRVCLRRWQMAGVSASIRLPKKGFGDLNDQLRAAAFGGQCNG